MLDGADPTTLTVSATSNMTAPKVLDEPLNVCVPVQVLAALKETVDNVPDVGKVTEVVPLNVRVKP